MHTHHTYVHLCMHMHARTNARSLARTCTCTHARAGKGAHVKIFQPRKASGAVHEHLRNHHACPRIRPPREQLAAHKQHKTLTANQRACVRAIEYPREKEDSEKSESQGEIENETDTEPTTKERARARDRLMHLHAPVTSHTQLVTFTHRCTFPHPSHHKLNSLGDVEVRESLTIACSHKRTRSAHKSAHLCDTIIIPA